MSGSQNYAVEKLLLSSRFKLAVTSIDRYLKEATRSFAPRTFVKQTLIDSMVLARYARFSSGNFWPARCLSAIGSTRPAAAGRAIADPRAASGAVRSSRPPFRDSSSAGPSDARRGMLTAIQRSGPAAHQAIGPSGRYKFDQWSAFDVKAADHCARSDASKEGVAIRRTIGF